MFGYSSVWRAFRMFSQLSIELAYIKKLCSNSDPPTSGTRSKYETKSATVLLTANVGKRSAETWTLYGTAGRITNQRRVRSY